MTTGEKAAETRKQNREKQKQSAEARADVRRAIMAACVEAINSDDTTPSEKLRAALLLDEIRKEYF